MSHAVAARPKRLLIIVNPKSKTGADADWTQLTADHASGHDCVLHKLQGDQPLTQVARQAAESGFDLVAAAGGDGTVAAVASALVGTKTRLGIIPLGTSNVLARDLDIPLNTADALRLLLESPAVLRVDAMKVGDQYLFTQLGVGINALAIQGATAENKRRFGRFAYMWAGAVQLLGFNPKRFTISIDGRVVRTRALQVMIINSSAVGTLGIQWGSEVRSDDGEIEVCLMRGRSVWDYAGMWWSLARGKARHDPRISYRKAKALIEIASRPPLPVQGDGEILGDTPLRVEVIPGAVEIVVPEAKA